MSEYILEMRNITKEFPGVKALDQVSFKVKKGEIKALVGENGAGKSTLMNVLSGIYPYGSYTGDIVINDQVCQFKGIEQSEQAGIAIIHQELAMIPLLSIAENVFIGNPAKKRGIIDWIMPRKYNSPSAACWFERRPRYPCQSVGCWQAAAGGNRQGIVQKVSDFDFGRTYCGLEREGQ